MKTCSGCLKKRPLTDFYECKYRYRVFRKTKCKSCNKAYALEWRARKKSGINQPVAGAFESSTILVRGAQ